MKSLRIYPTRTFVFIVMMTASFVASEANAQILNNTPFDPDTWNPNDWVQTPPPPKPPQPDNIVVRNLSTDGLSICIGDGRSLGGWFNVAPGKSFSYNLHTGNRKIAYAFILKGGKPVQYNLRSIYVPCHRSSAFKIKYKGSNLWDVEINRRVRGTFHNNSLAKLGFNGEKFYEFPVRNKRVAIDIR